MGPLTMGFERWANLPPAQYELQSFGHAAVTEDGALEIKLIRIDGMIMFEKTMTAPAVVAAPVLTKPGAPTITGTPTPDASGVAVAWSAPVTGDAPASYKVEVKTKAGVW